jgi:hypothetical protein
MAVIAVAAAVVVDVVAARRIVADQSGTATAVGRCVAPRQDSCDANVCRGDGVVPMTMTEKTIRAWSRWNRRRRAAISYLSIRLIISALAKRLLVAAPRHHDQPETASAAGRVNSLMRTDAYRQLRTTVK